MSRQEEARAKHPNLHYHAWIMADRDNMLYRSGSHWTRAGAVQHATNREPDPERRHVLRCTKTKCAPKRPKGRATNPVPPGSKLLDLGY